MVADTLGSLEYSYHHREVTLALGGHSGSMWGLDGTPAGGVTSPFCWNATTKELVVELN